MRFWRLAWQLNVPHGHARPRKTRQGRKGVTTERGRRIEKGARENREGKREKRRKETTNGVEGKKCTRSEGKGKG